MWLPVLSDRRCAGGVPPSATALSHRTFEYIDLKADEAATLTVTNTGQLCRCRDRPALRHSRTQNLTVGAGELKGFAKVFLAPGGESRTVSIALDDKAFRYWNVKTDRWEVEKARKPYQLAWVHPAQTSA